MNWKKFKLPIISYILYTAFFITFIIIAYSALREMGMLMGGVTPILPLNNMILEMSIILLVILPISSVLGAYGGYIVAPIILFIHKKTLGRKYDYSIQDKPISDKFQTLTRGFVPALMAMNIGFLLSVPEVKVLILTPMWTAPGVDTMISLIGSMMAMIVLLIFTYGISNLLNIMCNRFSYI